MTKKTCLHFLLLPFCLFCSNNAVYSADATDQLAEIDRLLDLSLEGLLATKFTIGTRGEARDAMDSPVPIDVIYARDIERSGFTELGKILQRLLPSFNYAHATIDDGTDHARPFTLRGMGSDQVLVLVNGKRRHAGALLHVNDSIGRGSTSVDLNAIPIRGIERIEVLRDGSAAQYGSDAIAGIINIVLSAAPGSQVTGTLGKTAQGDGTLRQVDISYGTVLANQGFIHFNAELRDRAASNRSGQDTRQQFFDDDPRNQDPALNNQITHRHGDPDTQDALLLFNAELPLRNGPRVYSFGTLNYRESEAAGFFRRPLDDRNVAAIYPNGFLPLITPEILDISLALGIKGDINSVWRWDVSNVLAHNRFNFFVRDSLNASLGAASPTSFDAGGLRFSQNTSNFDLAGTVDIGWAKPMQIGLGAELRLERFEIQRGETASFIQGQATLSEGPNAGAIRVGGAQVFPGFRPENEADESRLAFSTYADLELHPRDRLLLALAGRYEYFDDFGSTLNGKLASAFKPIQGLVVRSSVSTGFRAPSLAQSYFTSTATKFIDGEAFEVGTFSVDSPLARALGASDLKPEKSLHLATGFSYQATPALRLSGDIFYTQIHDRIILSSDINQDPEAVGQVVADLLQSFGVEGARFFTNAIDTETQGVDLSAHYDWNFANAATLSLQAQFHANQTKIITIDTPAALGANADFLLDRRVRERIENGQPNTNFMLSANYQQGRYHLLLRFLRFGEVTLVHDLADANADQRVDPRWLTDLDLSYRLNRSWQLAIGGHNIFNTYPEFQTTTPGNSFNGNGRIFQYPENSPFGFSGAFYYLRIRADFD